MLDTVGKEIWRFVPGYEGCYEVSSLGRVRSVDRVVLCRRKGGIFEKRLLGSLKVQTVDNGKHAYGRLQVKLCRAGKKKTHLVHRLVANAFLGPCPVGHEVAHFDGNPSNNRLDNIRYATPAENNQDKIRHGTVVRGEESGTAKLTQEEVSQIRRERSNGSSLTDLSEKFEISIAQVSRVANGRQWRHLDV